MRRIALGAMLLAGCLGERTTHCPGGYVCPDNLACAQAPVYCGKQEQVAACDGKQAFDACAFTSSEPGACYGGVCFACDADREGCGASGWSAMTPATVNLYGVWAATRGDAYAVGEHATLLHYDGTAWTSAMLPAGVPDVPLHAVWGSDSASVFVVGESGVILQYDGMTWSLATPSTAILRGVWGSGPRDVYAAGYTNMPAGTILHYDGSAWSTVAIGTQAPLYGIAGSSATDIYAVGKGGFVLHYDGASWTTLAAFGSGPDLDAAWARGANDAFFAGGTSNTVLDHYTGSMQPVTVAGCSSPLYALWGTTGALYGAGVGGCIVSSSDGATFTAVPPPAGAGAPDLHAIAGSSANDVFAVGASGAIWHGR